MLKRDKGNREIVWYTSKVGIRSQKSRLVVVKGQGAGERIVERLMRRLTAEEKEAGLRFACHETTDPVTPLALQIINSFLLQSFRRSRTDEKEKRPPHLRSSQVVQASASMFPYSTDAAVPHSTR